VNSPFSQLLQAYRQSPDAADINFVLLPLRGKVRKSKLSGEKTFYGYYVFPDEINHHPLHHHPLQSRYRIYLHKIHEHHRLSCHPHHSRHRLQ